MADRGHPRPESRLHRRAPRGVAGVEIAELGTASEVEDTATA